MGHFNEDFKMEMTLSWLCILHFLLSFTPKISLPQYAGPWELFSSAAEDFRHSRERKITKAPQCSQGSAATVHHRRLTQVHANIWFRGELRPIINNSRAPWTKHGKFRKDEILSSRTLEHFCVYTLNLMVSKHSCMDTYNQPLTPYLNGVVAENVSTSTETVVILSIFWWNEEF